MIRKFEKNDINPVMQIWKIDTTMEYVMVNQNNVKNSHRKYIT